MSLDAVPQIPIWIWLVIVGVVLIVVSFVVIRLVRKGYTVYSEITGFGVHHVKTTTTWEYSGDGEKLDRKIVAEEEQTPRTLWDGCLS